MDKNNDYPGMWKGNNFYAGYSMKEELAKLPPKGMIWCPKHKNTYFDPKKFKECYLCYQQRKKVSENG